MAHAGDYSPGTLPGNLQRAIRWSCPAKVLSPVADLVGWHGRKGLCPISGVAAA